MKAAVHGEARDTAAERERRERRAEEERRRRKKKKEKKKTSLRMDGESERTSECLNDGKEGE